MFTHKSNLRQLINDPMNKISLSPAPLYNDIALSADNGQAYWLKTSDGFRIRVALWHHQIAKGTILLFTGRTEYIEFYGKLIRELYAREYNVVIFDWRGQGLSERFFPKESPLYPIGHINRFSDYQHDVEAVMSFCQTQELVKPYYLLAHSMGGAIGLRSIYNGLNIKSAAFTSPMWGISLNPMVRWSVIALANAAKLLGKDHISVPAKTPDLEAWQTPFEGNLVTNDPQEWSYTLQQLKAHPELHLASPSYSWILEALRECRALAKLPPPLNCPAYVALGTDEHIVSPKAIYQKMAHWPNGELDVYEGASHSIMIEAPKHQQHFIHMIDELFSNSSAPAK